MKISLQKALKAPFERHMMIPCAFWGVSFLSMLLFIVIPTFSTYTAFLIIGLLTQVVSMGYSLSFSHNALVQSHPLFENLSFKIIKLGLKSIGFGLLIYVFLALLAIPVFLSIKFTPIWFSLFVLAISLIFAFLYVLTAWTKFIQTFQMTEALRVPSTTRLLIHNFPSYLKMLFYMILAMIVSFVPIFLLKLASTSIVEQFPISIFLVAFLTAFLIQYPVYVNFHIMAQTYGNIEKKMHSIQHTVSEKDESTSKKTSASIKGQKVSTDKVKRTSKKASASSQKNTVKKVKANPQKRTAK